MVLHSNKIVARGGSVVGVFPCILVSLRYETKIIYKNKASRYAPKFQFKLCV